MYNKYFDYYTKVYNMYNSRKLYYTFFIKSKISCMLCKCKILSSQYLYFKSKDQLIFLIDMM